MMLAYDADYASMLPSAIVEDARCWVSAHNGYFDTAPAQATT